MAESKTPLTDSPSAVHTPTPWKFNLRVQRKSAGLYGADYTKLGDILAKNGDAANAEFIVRAVNSHQDLLKACKAAREVLNHNPAFANGYYVKMLDAAIEKAERPAE